MRDVGPAVERREPPPKADALAARRDVLVPGVGRHRLRARLLLEPRRDERTDEHPHQHDQDEPADELGQRELPAEEDPRHDPELEDEVRRGELERHRGREARPFLEHRLRDRDRRVAARRGGRAERRREPERTCVAAAQRPLHPRPRHPRLHDPREQEAEDERPRHLPRHLEGVPQPLPELAHDVHDTGITAASSRDARGA